MAIDEKDVKLETPAKTKATGKIVAKKKAVKPVVKKSAAKSVVKKKATKPAVKKTAAKPAVKKKINTPVLKKKTAVKKKVKAIVSGSSAATKMDLLKVNLAEINQELSDLKAEIKSTKKRESAAALLATQREAAVNKFLISWDKKASAALEKSLSVKKKAAKKKKAKK